jgi:DHA3 family macrolide efflux protein-like MFS transporter
VLIGGILLGLVLGLLAGGRLTNLAQIHLRWLGVLLVAVIVRFGTETLLNAGVDIVDTLRLPLLLLGFGLLLVGLWANRGYPGMGIAFVGILLNTIVIAVNGGYMPVWDDALAVAGMTPADVTSALHIVVDGTIEEFLFGALVLGDIIPIPLPIVQNVASLGDVFLSLGLGFFLFASVVRVPTELEADEEEAIRERLIGIAASTRLPRPEGHAVAAETGLAPSIAETAGLDRPVLLGSATTGLATPALAPLPPGARELDRELIAEATAAGAFNEGVTVPGATPGAPSITLPRPTPETLDRVRRHPYVRLALNGSFSALWAGQLVSLFGDRVHQVALGAAVYIVTGSAVASAFVFVAAFVPNLFISPIAGTFVDRWDRKEVLIVSDLLRAATVLLIPIAVSINVLLVYPMVFVMTTISIFFRPARVAILPGIVRKDELVTANSALWVGETLADVIGYPLAGLFVAAIGSALPVAFWLDAATYIASAALLGTMIVRTPEEIAAEDDELAEEGAVTPPDEVHTGAGEGFVAELKAGYRFLRTEPVLFANTIQATVAQLTVGALTALTVTYAFENFIGSGFDPKAIYPFIEASVGAGNLVGGFVIGLIAMRVAKGPMISVGYVLTGLCTALLGLTGHLGIALGLAFGLGVANMIFVIPSQALFQERTPSALMGRVVGFRFALVFGAMSFAMAVGGVLAEATTAGLVFVLFGLVSVGAGVAGFFVPAIRHAT